MHPVQCFYSWSQLPVPYWTLHCGTKHYLLGFTLPPLESTPLVTGQVYQYFLLNPLLILRNNRRCEMGGSGFIFNCQLKKTTLNLSLESLTWSLANFSSPDDRVVPPLQNQVYYLCKFKCKHCRNQHCVGTHGENCVLSLCQELKIIFQA